MVGYHGVSAEAEAAMRAAFPMKLGPGSINARAVMTKGPVQIADIRLDPEYGLKTQAEEGGWRSAVAVPMLLHGQVIGAVTVCRAEPGLFPDKLVALLQTFADQAVIAIENARLFNETQEALERQTATAEILRVISGSPTDVQPVLEAIAHSSNRLLDGLSTAVFLIVDNTLHLKAFTKISDEADQLLQAAFPAPLDAYPGGAQIRAGSVAQMTDIEVDWAAHPKLLATARKRGFRSVLWTPLIRDGAAIGMISVTRVATGSFAPHHVELLRTFADQAVIAIENVRLFNETKEALEQQTATAEILRVISESPTDVQPVFDAIAERAMALCGGSMGAATRVDGELLDLVSYRGTSARGEAAMRAAFPMPISRGSANGRSILDRAPAQIADVRLDADYQLKEGADFSAWTSCLSVPLLHEGRAIGALAAARPEPGPFPEKSIALLETFARQAVIAIENVRLFNETKEALAHQTATAEVLRVISRSQTDVQPVFGAIAAAALRLCEATSANVVTFDGTLVHVAALASAEEQAADAVRALFASYPRPLSRDTANTRAILTRSVVMIPDVLQDPDYPAGATAAAAGYRSILAVPLLNADQAIGAITVARPMPGPVPDKQVVLLQTFADQAVIAIENVRLFNETREALERQTATAEVLRVISASVTETQPVFDVIAARAVRLTGASMGFVFRFDGELIHIASVHGVNEEGLDAARAAFPMEPGAGSATARAVREGAVVNVGDIYADTDGDYTTLDVARKSGYRAVLSVPMLRDGEIVGAISVTRVRAGRFADHEIELLKTFASQAVIAIANVHLFNETKEALERQTATSEVLNVMSRSPSDVQPVLDIVAERAGLLCRAEGSRVWLESGGKLHANAMKGYGTAYGRDSLGTELTLRPTSVVGRAFLERRTLHFDDVVPLIETEFPDVRELQAKNGFRTVLAVPMILKGESIGAIALLRNQVRPFSPAEIALVQTFADQAVIAIENVRLFKETNEALERQTATAEVLRVISASPTDVQPVFDAIAERARALCAAKIGTVARFDGEFIHVVAFHGATPEAMTMINSVYPLPPGDRTVIARAVRDQVPVLIPDVSADPEYGSRDGAEQAGYRSLLGVPMLRDGQVIGAIGVARAEVGLFPEKQVTLLQTFADQAVIAIENVRLFNETREALEQQTATAEVLQVISSSVADAAPVFDKILIACERLFKGNQLMVFLIDKAEQLSIGAIRGPDADRIERTRRIFPVPLAGTATEQAIRERRLVTYADVLHDARGARRTAPNRSPIGRDVFDRDRADAVGGRGDRLDPGQSQRAQALRRQGAAAAANLRRPGSDRDPERADVQRDSGSARTPDRDRRHPARHQRVADRRAAGVRGDRRAAACACSRAPRWRSAARSRAKCDAWPSPRTIPSAPHAGATSSRSR